MHREHGRARVAFGDGESRQAKSRGGAPPGRLDDEAFGGQLGELQPDALHLRLLGDDVDVLGQPLDPLEGRLQQRLAAMQGQQMFRRLFPRSRPEAGAAPAGQDHDVAGHQSPLRSRRRQYSSVSRSIRSSEIRGRQPLSRWKRRALQT